MDNRYIQLYSLKDEIAKDYVGTLKRLVAMGYTGVEFAGGFYGGYDAPELKKLLAELGLEALSTHISSDQAAEQLDYAVKIGVKYLIDPMAVLNNDQDALAYAQKLNATGRLCKERGISFGYHNHRHEFLDGKDGYLLETLLLNTDPEYVCFQLDVGWASCAGADVPALLQKYAGRFKLIHVKECSKVDGPERMPDFASFPRDESGRPQIPPEVIAKFMEQTKWNAPSGQGIINWPVVRDAALAQGAEAFIVEREYNYAGDIFKCVGEDCAYLKTL